MIAGTLETKPIESITKEMIKDCLINQAKLKQHQIIRAHFDKNVLEKISNYGRNSDLPSSKKLSLKHKPRSNLGFGHHEKRVIRSHI